MCGRYTLFLENEANELGEIIDGINRLYTDTPEHAAMKTGEVFPTDVVPVLVGREAHPALMVWGFPKWQGSGVIINARAETALEKPMFRGSLGARRCVVPSTGFYEWRHEGERKKKEKYLLKLPDGPMLYMAGFYNTFKDRLGKPYSAFVILTTEANASVAPLHNRMPLLLDRGQRERWLGDFDGAVGLLDRQDGVALSAEPAD